MKLHSFFFSVLVALLWPASTIRAESGPDAIYEKPLPISQAEFGQRLVRGVEAAEVNDYKPSHFTGDIPSGGTHADHNHCVAIVADAYSDKQYRKFWDDHGQPRRAGNADLLWQISKSKGFALIEPFKDGYEFVIIGEAGGFPAAQSQVVDHSYNDTGGWGWGAIRVNHWPIGWLDSQEHVYDPALPYPYHLCPLSHYIAPFRFCNGENKNMRKNNEWVKAYSDMEHNRWTERHVYYTLSGVAKDVSAIKRLARKWLDKSQDCTRPESIKRLSVD